VYLAASYNQANVITTLADEKAAMDTPTIPDGFRAIHIAARFGHTKTIRALKHANVDLNSPTTDGSTPVHIAILLEQLEAVKVLIELKADLNLYSKKRVTPLTLAAELGHVAIVETLLEFRA